MIGKNPKKFSFPLIPFSFFFLLFTLYLLSPLALIDGALWGQVDSLGVFIFLIAILLAIKDKPFLAGIIFMLSMMTKLQNMVYGPLFFLFLWQLTGYRGLIRGMAGALVSFIGLNIEFFFAREMGRVIEYLTSNYDYFPLLSLNAYNLWWIVAKGQGMDISDKINTIGILNAKTTGLLLFSSGYLLAVLTMMKNTWNTLFLPLRKERTKFSPDSLALKDYIHGRKVLATEAGSKFSFATEVDNKSQSLFLFLIGLVIVNASFFFFQTESHDRYLFPQSVFLLLLAPFLIYIWETVKNRITWWRTRTFKLFVIGYILFTCFYFINLHNALISNYPSNGISILSFLLQPTITIAISYILIGLFFILLFSLRTIIGFIPFFISVSFFLVSIFICNLPYMTKKPISLTSLTPLSSTQGYGHMVINMPVGAFGPSKNWNRLSSQYLFYKQGIGTHANSSILYDIGGKFSQFTSDYGIDTESGPQGSVVFEIVGDGTTLFRSDIIKRYDLPRHMDVNIQGVKHLELKVTDGGNGITDDHADWLSPTLWTN